ncbi:MAG: lysophospholipid acyltransferase family protein [Acidimicrobiia bacterium]
MEWSYPGAEMLLSPVLAATLRFDVEGVAMLPTVGPAILASNHISYLDPLVLGYVARRRQRRLRFLAKAELFRNPVLGALLRNGGQIPVERNSPRAVQALTGGLDALARGECLAVFPEGTISDDLNLLPGRSGVARLAARSGAPVVPVALWGAQRVWPDGRRPDLRFRPRIVVVFGEPFIVEKHVRPRDATDQIMRGICAALRRARTLLPGTSVDWWHRDPDAAVVRTCKDAG